MSDLASLHALSKTSPQLPVHWYFDPHIYAVEQRLLFERGCISCHSLEGNAMVGPTFKGLFGAKVIAATAGVEHTIVADSAYIYRSIVDPRADVVSGFPNTMPLSRDILDDQEIYQIIAYLKGLK